MKNIVALLAVFILFMTQSANAELYDPDEVQVYIVPMIDFPEPAAAQLSKILSDDMKIWVKSSVRLGDLEAATLPGTRQLSGDSVIEKSYPIVTRLPGSSKNTVYVLLTTRDINSETGAFRFQFSMHHSEMRVSVVSMARMIEFADGKPVVNHLVLNRLYKMCKRAIGEQYFGWKRSTDINDIMYSPIMGMPDLDRIGIHHKENDDENEVEPVDKNRISI